jgi:hypothetical protein
MMHTGDFVTFGAAYKSWASKAAKDNSSEKRCPSATNKKLRHQTASSVFAALVVLRLLFHSHCARAATFGVAKSKWRFP